uniref:Vesicle-fusing ATPase n=2 Tax=Strongyloides stercoralis TaxID=6248 RepID=A0A0K0DX31_STRER
MSIVLKVRKVPTDELAVSNCAVVNRDDFDSNSIKHIIVQTGPAHRFAFSIKNHPGVSRGEIGFGVPARKWAALSLDQNVQCSPFTVPNNQLIESITVDIDFFTKKGVCNDVLDSDDMSREFSMQFSGQVFTEGQQLVFKYQNPKDKKEHTFSLNVIVITGMDVNAAIGGGGGESTGKIYFGQLMGNSMIIFDKREGAQLNLTGKSKGKTAFKSIISPDWDFESMGIGGLDKEFSAIFRRAFFSRLFPPEQVEQLGMKHVRGILLYGPPGTGKTLIARQIGKMLNAREPKIVNGPQILDKYVGESEANIRKLFGDAEEEFKRCGNNSALHIIIFDEIDAICKQRGTQAGSSGVHDTVVNQILTKMDGVDQLNNILVIGMTNRRDMIDEALLRPGRMEVQMEISLPDENGRVQILHIHTAKMREFDKLGSDVDLKVIAKKTKNFSGAEIEGLVRAAQSSAINRLVKVDGKVTVEADAFEKLKITAEDFEYALLNDIKPAFGSADEVLERFLSGGILMWSPEISKILETGDIHINDAKSPDSRGFVTLLLAGSPGVGKSCLAAQIAKNSGFPFVKICTPETMVGYTEIAKCQALRKIFEDAYRSPLSVIIIDNIDRLLDYASVGPRFSNQVLQALLVLLGTKPPKGKRLLVLATASQRTFLKELDLMAAFDDVIDVPMLRTVEHIRHVLDDSNVFSPQDIQSIERDLRSAGDVMYIGIKKILRIIDYTKQCDPRFRASTFVEKVINSAFNQY